MSKISRNNSSAPVPDNKTLTPSILDFSQIILVPIIPVSEIVSSRLFEAFSKQDINSLEEIVIVS